MDPKELEKWRKACAGDVDSYEWVFRTYQPRLFFFCQELLHDRDVAKDLVQEAFIILWEHLPTIRQTEAAPRYLFSVLRNLCRRESRKRMIISDFRNVALSELHEAEIEWFLNEPGVLEDIYHAELRQKWQFSLDKLPARLQQIVKMRIERDMSNREIAEELQLSVRTVEDEYYKGLKALRFKLMKML